MSNFNSIFLEKKHTHKQTNILSKNGQNKIKSFVLKDKFGKCFFARVSKYIEKLINYNGKYIFFKNKTIKLI